MLAVGLRKMLPAGKPARVFSGDKITSGLLIFLKARGKPHMLSKLLRSGFRLEPSYPDPAALEQRATSLGHMPEQCLGTDRAWHSLTVLCTFCLLKVEVLGQRAHFSLMHYGRAPVYCHKAVKNMILGS